MIFCGHMKTKYRKRREAYARALILLVLFPYLAMPVALADSSSASSEVAQQAAQQIISVSKWMAIAGFMATLLITTAEAVITSKMMHRPLGLSYTGLITAGAFLALLFSLDAVYATLGNIIGLKGQYEIAITHVENRINNTKAILTNLGIVASISKATGEVLLAAGEKGLESLEPSIAKNVTNILNNYKLIAAGSVAAAAAGGVLTAVGNALYSMFNTITFYYGFFMLSLYGILFLLKFFGELPLWLAFASLGLAVATFKPLRGLGASLFATMLVFGFGLSLVINGMELAMTAMGIPSNKTSIYNVELTGSPLDALVIFSKIASDVLFNPGNYVWTIYQGIAESALVPSIFYGIGLAILAGGAAELARWMSESAAFYSFAYHLTSVVKPL